MKTRCICSSLTAVLALLGAKVEAEDSWKFGPGVSLSAPKADFRVALAGYVQADVRSFPNWDVAEEEGVEPLRGDTFEWRRLRVGIEAEWKWLSGEVIFDPNDEFENVKNAYGEIRFYDGLRVRGGRFKPPMSAERLTSASRTDFVDRSLLANRLAPDRDVGVMLHGEIRKRFEYQLGLFAGDGRASDERAGTTKAARLVVIPIEGFSLGAALMLGEVEAANVSEPQPKGFKGVSPSGFPFFQRRHVNGERRRIGLEAAYVGGPVSLKAEALQAREERLGQGSTCRPRDDGFVCDDVPPAVGTGWAASATWLLTGENKKKNLKPRRPLPGIGAWEIGVRVESLRFDDDGPDTGFPGVGNRARNIRPQADRVLTVGLSWWPNEWLRFMGDAIVERYEDGLLAPEPDRTGDYVTLVGRMQFQLP